MKSEVAEFVAALISGTAAIAVIMPDQETRVLCFCIISAAIGGFIGVEKFSEGLKPREKVWRWLSNFGAGIIMGPMATEYLAEKLDQFKVAYVALLAGGLCGAAGVVFLGIALPYFFKWIQTLAKTKPRLP